MAGAFRRRRMVDPACSYLKRAASGTDWDKAVNDNVTRMTDVSGGKGSSCRSVEGGKWERGRIWFDASRLAVDVWVEVAEQIIEHVDWKS